MKIAFLSMPLAGHLNPMTALARRLQSRGHEIVLIGVPDVEFFARAAYLNFVPFCEKEYPAGSTSRAWGEVAKRHGLDVVLHTTQHLRPVLLKAPLKRCRKSSRRQASRHWYSTRHTSFSGLCRCVWACLMPTSGIFSILICP